MDRAMKRSIVAAFVGAALLAGCHADPENIQAWAKPYETNVTADRYVVEPPDEIGAPLCPGPRSQHAASASPA